jgi:hypothetical protein
MDQMNFNGDNFSEEQQEQLLFMMLIQQHQQIAMMGMGKIENPSGKVERELKSAKFAIDTLLMLEKYTEGNLPNEIKKYLKETLNNLRINYADEKGKDDSGSEKGGD